MQQAHVRASDVDREEVSDFLRAHCAEGRLSADELDERLERVYSARTLGDLRTVGWDLPDRPGAYAVEPRRASPVPRIAMVLALLTALALVSTIDAAGIFFLVVLIAVFSVILLIMAPYLAGMVALAWIIRRLGGGGTPPGLPRGPRNRPRALI